MRTTAEALFGEGSYPQAVFDFLGQTFPDRQIPDKSASEEAFRDATRKACALEAPLSAWQLPYNSRNDDYDSWYPSIYRTCALNELPKTLFRIAQGLQHLTVTQSTLGVGMYLSNVAVLQDAASNDAARTIYNLTGTEFVAPRYSQGPTIAISMLIGLQALILALLVCYIYSLPTWTDTLDAFAMMRIGAKLRGTMNVPLLSRVNTEELGTLDETDGLLGVIPGRARGPEEDLELAAMASASSSTQINETHPHRYEMVSPLSPTSTVSSRDLSTSPAQAHQPSGATMPGMPTSELSSYLQGAPPVSPTVSSVRSPSPPPPYLPARSPDRDQSARGPFELGLGAPGLITRAFWAGYRPT